MQVRCELFTLAQEKGLFPEAAGAAIIVISGDDEDGDFHLADRLTSSSNRSFDWAWAVEQVASNEDELRFVRVDGLADALQDVKAFILEAGAIFRVFDALIGFAELPVGGVDESGGHEQGATSRFT
jgi:hypothetical protein